MNAPTPIRPEGDAAAIAELMQGLGRAAKSAAKTLAQASTEAKNAALKAAAAAIRERRADLLAANRADVDQATQ